MRIVYFDHPDHLPDWAIAQLSPLGSFELFSEEPDEPTARSLLARADIAVLERLRVTGEMLDGGGLLKHIVVAATDCAFVDIEAAARRGITVSNTPEYSRQSVAEHVFALFLCLAKRITAANALALSGSTHADYPFGRELSASTLGILGFGSIGSWVARIGMGFGMKVQAFNRSPIQVPNVTQSDLEDVLRTSDFIAACLPVTGTAGLLSRQHLNLLKPDAIFVNISENSILDELALAQMLEEGTLLGAGLEYAHSTRLRQAPNVLVTLGTAWYTSNSMARKISTVAGTIQSCLDGKPRYVVNAPRS